MKSKKTVLFLSQAAIIAALYVVLCVVFAPISYGPVQCRIAEALTILPVFTPAAIPGLFIGCITSNLVGGSALPDVIFGSLATFLAAYATYRLRRFKFTAPLPPIFFNTLIIPFVLQFAYSDVTPLPLLALYIFIGEVISCGILGLSLLAGLAPFEKYLFPKKS